MTDATPEQLQRRLQNAKTERGRLNTKRKAIVADAASRGLSDLELAESAEFRRLSGELDNLDDIINGSEEELRELEENNETETGRMVRAAMGGTRGSSNTHPLAYTSQALDSLQRSIDTRTASRVQAGDTEQRAALATTTYGAPRVWGANVVNGPRLLHIAAGVPQQPADAVLAQVPNLTLPTASASVGENVTLAEYAASTAGSVTLARFGRWTDLSRESMIGADAGAIVAMHTIGCAKDLDSTLIGAVNTAAGAAVGFTADVPAAVRTAMARVADNTAASDASDLVILVHPDNAALLQDVSPIGGITQAEGFSKFSGALVYASSAVPTGFALVANLKAGARYFEAQRVMTETEVATKTGTLTVATSVIGGYGLGLVGGASGFAIKVDVVTP